PDGGRRARRVAHERARRRGRRPRVRARRRGRRLEGRLRRGKGRGMTELAILGGTPGFPEAIPFVRPPAPDLARVVEILGPSWERGALTNGPLVAELERRSAEFLQVPHVVAVSSCTTGLMLALRALDVDGDVVLPSFTFSASAH